MTYKNAQQFSTIVPVFTVVTAKERSLLMILNGIILYGE